MQRTGMYARSQPPDGRSGGRNDADSLRVTAGCLDVMEEAVVLLDVDGRVRHTNHAFQRLSARSLSSVAGQSVETLWCADPAERQLWDWNEMWDGRTWRGQHYLVRSDGMPIPVEITLRSLRSAADDIEGFVLVLWETTSPQVSTHPAPLPGTPQETRRSASAAAHDCNNHLAVILNYTYILSKQLTAEPTLSAYVDEMQKSAWEAAQLTDHLLDLTRPRGPRVNTLQVNRALQGLHSLLEQAVGRDVRLRTRTAPDVPAALISAGPFEQIVLNLVLSARDLMQGQGAIEIATRAVEVEAPIASMSKPVPPARYVLLEIKHWSLRTRSVRDSQPFHLGSTTGPAIALDAIQQANGYLVYDSSHTEMNVTQVYLPHA